jgi:predicted membrane protein
MNCPNCKHELTLDYLGRIGRPSNVCPNCAQGLLLKLPTTQRWLLTVLALCAAAGSPTVSAMIGMSLWLLLPIILALYLIAYRVLAYQFAEENKSQTYDKKSLPKDTD